jgi:FRG domain
MPGIKEQEISWDGFKEIIDREIVKKDYLKPLFRGQSDHRWALETTLERFLGSEGFDSRCCSFENYWRILRAIKPAIYSLADYRPNWDWDDEKFEHIAWEKFNAKNVGHTPPCYEFMIYVRHHSFPTPLLDWTRSPYVAAHFAFNGAKEDTDVAIYEYQESTHGVKAGSSGTPQIILMGPYAETHERHHLQQCSYTLCVKDTTKKQDRFVYQSHEGVDFGDSIADKLYQDLLTKYIIPSSEREKALYDLRLMNINSFSLMGNEEGLMAYLAEKEFFEERWIPDPKPVDKSVK